MPFTLPLQSEIKTQLFALNYVTASGQILCMDGNASTRRQLEVKPLVTITHMLMVEELRYVGEPRVTSHRRLELII